MENQSTPNLELSEKATTETTKRKRKLLTDPWKNMNHKCRVCGEPGNVENMLSQKVPFINGDDQVLYGCYEGVYFCSEICQEKFRLEKMELSNG